MERGAKVDYWEQGKLYGAHVASLSDSVIVLQDLNLVRTAGSSSEVQARQADSRVQLGTPESERRIARDDVQGRTAALRPREVGTQRQVLVLHRCGRGAARRAVVRRKS
ncbi:MAG: hypothetical protein U0527_01800 [Candidatus Eisenbacteria bacterium]